MAPKSSSGPSTSSTLLRLSNEPSDGLGRPGTPASVCTDSSPDRTPQQTRQDGVETVCELDAEVTSLSICGLRLAYNRVSTNVSRERGGLWIRDGLGP
jgi:hypothetical protein